MKANETRLPAAPVPRRHGARLRSWGETSEASAHIIALRIVAATAIPHPDRAFRDVKPGAIRANL